MSNCDPKNGTCEMPQNKPVAADACSSKCACGSDCCSDPATCQMMMLKAAFCEAMKATAVDIMKEKIKKAYGQKLDKAADAVLETMNVKMQSMKAMVKAKENLLAKLQTICDEA